MEYVNLLTSDKITINLDESVITSSDNKNMSWIKSKLGNSSLNRRMYSEQTLIAANGSDT